MASISPRPQWVDPSSSTGSSVSADALARHNVLQIRLNLNCLAIAVLVEIRFVDSDEFSCRKCQNTEQMFEGVNTKSVVQKVLKGVHLTFVYGDLNLNFC